MASPHSTRALSGSYTGPLYQVRRASDNTYKSIAPTSAGGYADAASQDSFCAGTNCTITFAGAIAVPSIIWTRTPFWRTSQAFAAAFQVSESVTRFEKGTRTRGA